MITPEEKAQVLRSAATELYKDLQQLPLEGRNTRAWWAVRQLDLYASWIEENAARGDAWSDETN